MTEEEKGILIALDYMLNMTGEDDWHLINDTVRRKVLAGEYSKAVEKEYVKMLNKKRKETIKKRRPK